MYVNNDYGFNVQCSVANIILYEKIQAARTELNLPYDTEYNLKMGVRPIFRLPYVLSYSCSARSWF